MGHLIAPSLLSANFGNLGKDLEMLNRSRADWIHADVMDGKFVPNISFGQPVIKQIRKLTTKPLDVHLMIVEPERYLKSFRDCGADILSVHYEASVHLHRTITEIKTLGMKAGVVLNPHTPVLLLEDIINEVDLVLLMSVNPGFGGQKFILNTFLRISQLREMIAQKGSDALIEIDGGVNTDNAQQLIDSGADVLVAGNAVFSSDDPERTISLLKFLKPSR
ncbi:MAG TPA: ribulose-phosphate 3-epimerase [Bacteroidales bacterium]|nr:ribulose-phosphate 3-epimerase [Bacteroidales bacterium]HPR58250.1 ribulose-phosphate 3-epimerase [Bacteroidales bacterium]HRW96055.1 ribulose-phosphate 3-epimerase [Bacteroidales bacterium]